MKENEIDKSLNKTNSQKQGEKNYCSERDIFLCLDNSYHCDSLSADYTKGGSVVLRAMPAEQHWRVWFGGQPRIMSEQKGNWDLQFNQISELLSKPKYAFVLSFIKDFGPLTLLKLQEDIQLPDNEVERCIQVFMTIGLIESVSDKLRVTAEGEWYLSASGL